MEAKCNKPKLTPTQTYLVARALNDSMKDFYKDPQNQAKFEDWKSKKGGKKGEIKRSSNSEG